MDTTSRRSRRGVLTGAAAAAAAATVATFARPLSAAADTGDPLVIGQFNTVTESSPGQFPPTQLYGGPSASGGNTLYVQNDAVNGRAIHGQATGANNDALFLGTSDGIRGYSQNGNGVLGFTVYATGVHGSSDQGTALIGTTESGHALKTVGRLDIGTSGVATIPSGSKTVTVTPGVDVSASSFVLLTPASNIGERSLWYTKSVANDTLTIHISASRLFNTRISWLLLG